MHREGAMSYGGNQVRIPSLSFLRVRVTLDVLLTLHDPLYKGNTWSNLCKSTEYQVPRTEASKC